VRIGSLLAALAAVASPAPAAEPPGVRLTVYNNNFALVKDVRQLEAAFRKGINILRFRDVAATIDATSVSFRSLTDPAAKVLEQNYEFDLVNANKLLDKYIDRKLSVFTKDGHMYEGVLMNFDGARLVLARDRKAGPIYMVERGDNVKRIVFSTLPEGLLTRPTLLWEVLAEKAGKHLVQLSYIANNIRWRADYNLVLGVDDKRLDLSGWVTLQNQTGTTYEDAAVKLMAGDPTPDYRRMHWGWGPDYFKTLSKMKLTARRGPDPSRAFGEYRLYKLPERTTVANRQIKQIELLKAAGVKVRKIYVYDGAKIHWYRHRHYWNTGFGRDENKKVNCLIEFENRADNRLGISLPKGKCRVYKRDAEDGSLEFIGEDLIDHTPREEKVTLYIGDAFDVVGERKQTDFRKIAAYVYEEAFEIKIRNHKAEPVTVQVLEKLYRWVNWELLTKSHEYRKEDSRTIIFPVTVKPDGEVTITYRVRYTYHQ
jgi:hypothetical protein